MNKRVEVLSFSGCPNVSATVSLVAEVAADLAVEVDLHVIDVPDVTAAVAQCFLGSPTIRIEGVDVEPGSETRTDFALACRLYQTLDGPRGLPTRKWLEAALRAG